MSLQATRHESSPQTFHYKHRNTSSQLESIHSYGRLQFSSLDTKTKVSLQNTKRSINCKWVNMQQPVLVKDCLFTPGQPSWVRIRTRSSVMIGFISVLFPIRLLLWFLQAAVFFSGYPSLSALSCYCTGCI